MNLYIKFYQEYPKKKRLRFFSLLENKEKEVMVMNLSNNEEKSFLLIY